MKKLLLPLLFLVAGILNAQEPCATMPAYYNYLNDPAQRETILAAESKARQWLNNPVNKSNAARLKNAVIRIPVVVHVVYKNAAQNIHDSLIHSQIAVLNECFRKQNANYVNTRSIFDTLGADTEIEFCLASEDPAGYPTTGIIRKQAPSNAQFDPLFGFDNMKKPSKGGDTAWANTTYFNIWVGDMSLFNTAIVLGYATFPGGDPALDGVVIQYDYFGKYAKPNFLGRTTVHEAGHWLGMRHIWADDDNGQNPQTVYCDSTDFVDDTPNAGPKSNTDCNLSKNTCPVEVAYWGSLDPPDMVENYMDYSADACMTLFTKGQKARMYSFLNTDPARTAIVTSTASCHTVITGISSDFHSGSFELFPVPAKETLTLKLSGNAKFAFSVFAADGRLMEKGLSETSEFKYDVSKLKSGIYLIEVAAEGVRMFKKFTVYR